jgi:2,4-dienoyl-CoA reductase-like NADH-dependent reductase (Old Yellow Enzyme family)
MHNQSRGMERVETWAHLCQGLRKAHKLSYIHFIEPRQDLLQALRGESTTCAVNERDREAFKRDWSLPEIGLKSFRDIFRDRTPVFSAGGWDDEKVWGVLEEGRYDALVFARWFLSTPDLVERFVVAFSTVSSSLQEVGDEAADTTDGQITVWSTSESV